MTFVLSKKTQILWQIRSVFAISFFCVILIFLECFNLLFLSIAIAGSVFLQIYTFYYFKSYKIIADDNSIIVTKGIVFKITNIMPYPRLIYAKTFTTPIASAMKIKCVMLKAARGWMFIPELENNKVDHLLQKLRIKKNEYKNL